MTKHSEYPAFKFHPETGESRHFSHAHEVPEGWLDNHPANGGKAEEKAPAAKAPAEKAPKAEKLPMSRKEIVKALVEGEIAFDKDAETAALYAVLDVAVREHLAANKIDIPEGANVPALLALAAK